MSGFDLNSIKKGACVKAPRIQIIASEGFGKTSFACCYTNKGQDKTEDTDTTFLIPIKGETGGDGLDVDKPDENNLVTTYAKLMEILSFLVSGDHPYKRIVIDSTSSLEPLIHQSVCDKHDVDNVRKVKGFRVGEAEVANHWIYLTDELEKLRSRGIEVVVITHAKIKNFKDPERDSYDRYVPDLEDAAASILNKWCDIIAFGNSEIIIKKEETGFGGNSRSMAKQVNPTRWLYLTPSAIRPGKLRPEFSRMPERIELDHVKFKEAMVASVSQ